LCKEDSGECKGVEKKIKNQTVIRGENRESVGAKKGGTRGCFKGKKGLKAS